VHALEDTPGPSHGPANFAVSMSRPEPRHPFVPVLLAWLVPGSGHFVLGRPWPALCVAAGVVPLFVLGLHLTGYEIVSPERHPWYFVTHVWAGLPTAFAALLTTHRTVTEILPYQEAGRLYTAVAGMLNLMAIADVWARCRRGDPELLQGAAAVGEAAE